MIHCFRQKWREYQNAYFIFSTSFRKSCNIWDNLEIINRARQATMPLWRVLISWWIPKATNRHSELCNNYCFSTATVVARTRLNVTLYVRCVSVLELCVSSDRTRTPQVPPEMSKQEVPNTICQSGPCDVVDQKPNLQIPVKVSVTDNTTCVSHTTKTFGL
jgi:hypothetical protein